MNINAIILFSKNLPSYTYCSLFQAHETNPNTPIYIISDINPKLPFVIWEPIHTFSSSWAEFEECYTHLNTCPDWLTRIWFYRWFAVRALMHRDCLTNCVHLDTDILLNLALETIDIPVKQGMLSLVSSCNGAFSGHFAVIDSAQTLELFLTFCLNMFRDPSRLDTLKRFFATQRTRPGGGGVCDMYAFGWASGWRGKDTVHLPVFELNDPDTFGVAFDTSITSSATFSETEYFEMVTGKKRIVRRGGWNFVRRRDSALVPAATIHFQGSNKNQMRKYVVRQSFLFLQSYWKSRITECFRDFFDRLCFYGRHLRQACVKRATFRRRPL
jgi:hypothetical protein